MLNSTKIAMFRLNCPDHFLQYLFEQALSRRMKWVLNPPKMNFCTQFGKQKDVWGGCSRKQTKKMQKFLIKNPESAAGEGIFACGRGVDGTHESYSQWAKNLSTLQYARSASRSSSKNKRAVYGRTEFGNRWKQATELHDGQLQDWLQRFPSTKVVPTRNWVVPIFTLGSLVWATKVLHFRTT